MNETLYENIGAVKDLNKVEGFDPAKLMRCIEEQSNDGTQSKRSSYLDVAYRKLWFRLKYPQGAVKKFVREITDQFAIVEAKVYLDRNDPPDSYIANAIVKRYFNPEDKFGDKYLETAETAAVGRALADAGFGIQFADSIENPDLNVVDAPVGLPNGITTNTITNEVMQSPQTVNVNVGAPQSIEEDDYYGSDLPFDPPAQYQSAPTQPIPVQPVAAKPAQINPTSVRPAHTHSAPVQPTQVNRTQAVQTNSASAQPIQSAQMNSASVKPTFTSDSPIEVILSQMTLDYAVNVVVDIGRYRGKALGVVATESPSSLNWYANTYNGKNNILRAAAKYLLERASA